MVEEKVEKTKENNDTPSLVDGIREYGRHTELRGIINGVSMASTGLAAFERFEHPIYLIPAAVAFLYHLDSKFGANYVERLYSGLEKKLRGGRVLDF